MFNKQKKGMAQIVLILLIIILLVFISFFIDLSKLKLAILPQVNFAGFTWSVDKQGVTQCDGNANVNEFATLNGKLGSSGGQGSGNSCEIRMTTQQDISNIDEFLIIFDSILSAGSNSGSTVGIAINEQGVFSEGVNANQNQYFEPKIIKLRNNFDGTYSVLKSLNVGDVFIEQKKITVTKPVYLTFAVNIGGSAISSGGSASMTVYNIVRKENAFAICKVNEYLTTDEKGKQICKSLNTIVLNSEEAIKESFNEKLVRITTELEAKNTGLTADITALKQQLAQQQTTEQITVLQQRIIQLESQLVSAQDKTVIQQQIDLLKQQQLTSPNLQDRIFALESELKETKSILADVQAKDKNVVNVIAQKEQFKEPNIIKTFFNKIIAWIKNLFS